MGVRVAVDPTPTYPDLRRRRAAQVASYMRAVLRTVAQCHAHRILHRDVKPGARCCLPYTS